MRVLIISNDVTPDFDVPVAAPGLRAAGLAEGLRYHGHDVTIAVPSDLLASLFGSQLPAAPAHTVIVAPESLHSLIVDGRFVVVIFINANLTPHLRPIAGVHFVYDLFAPKILESLATSARTRPWQELSAEKSRAMALADSVWVNGKRKLGYGLSWLIRPDVETIRVNDLGLPSIIDSDVTTRLSVVEMPVPLPPGIHVPQEPNALRGQPRLGVAGYAQAWSSLDAEHIGHRMIVDAGFELHALIPKHWGAGGDVVPNTVLPEAAVQHAGPMLFDDFARWAQGMDVMVDVFAPSAERRFAMITRSAVSLRLGIPLIHAVDSEIAEIVRDHNAGWTLDPDDIDAWVQVVDDLGEPSVMHAKRAGAIEASQRRFAPPVALARAAAALDTIGSRQD